MRALTMDEVGVVGGMRELTAAEIAAVSGAAPANGINPNTLRLLGGAIEVTEISSGVLLSTVGTVAVGACWAGWTVGTYVVYPYVVSPFVDYIRMKIEDWWD